jgi:hypothetical protein
MMLIEALYTSSSYLEKKKARVWHAWLSGKLRDLHAGHRGSNPGLAGDFMSRHMPPASPQEV